MMYKLFLSLLILLLVPDLYAADISVAGVDVSLTDNGEGTAKAIQVLGLITVLSLAPALLIMLTGFTRIVIVLAMLRQAFGMPSTPPNSVLMSLALILTFYTMLPVIDELEVNAYVPLSNNQISADVALQRASISLKQFMLKQTREKDLKLMFQLAKEELPDDVSGIKLGILAPAFLLSELQTAFQIGFVIFLPFLLIDLISASVLMSMGMIMVPPLTLSLPIKILMFVLIEGWALVAKALVGSFA